MPTKIQKTISHTTKGLKVKSTHRQKTYKSHTVKKSSWKKIQGDENPNEQNLTWFNISNVPIGDRGLLPWISETAVEISLKNSTLNFLKKTGNRQILQKLSPSTIYHHILSPIRNR